MKNYLNLLSRIIAEGERKANRTGIETLSLFCPDPLRFDLREGLPILTTRKQFFSTAVKELLWFLRGDTNIKFLHDNDCHIWDGDYEKSGRKDGELGPIYGKQWRSWEKYQITNYNGVVS